VIGEWKSFLLDRAEDWQLPTTGKWSAFVHNNYHPHCSNVNLMWFHMSDEFPRIVTKLYREPDILKREFENLSEIHARAPRWVPRPLHFGFQGGFWAMWMSGVPGYRFRGGGKYSPETLRSMAEAVAGIHAATRKTEVPDPDRYRRIVSEPLQSLGRFGASVAVRAGCAELEARVSADSVNAFPVVPQHGDLFSGNLLSHAGKWYVVDWESFGKIDLPFYDLLTLLVSLLLEEGRRPEQWNVTLVKQIPALISAYARGLGVAVANVHLMLPLTLANWFHMQWSDGRKEFAEMMYKAIEHYFERPAVWENVFSGELKP
jgi:aminoglycoside phosphotransferase (APT) family kinase protein